MATQPKTAPINKALVIRKLSLVSVIGNAVLSGFKLFAGITGHSSAMISDAIHSFSDVLTTLIAWIGVKVSKKASDEEHPYGHERLECIASLLLGGVLSSLASGEEVTAVVAACTAGLYYVGGVGLSVLLCLLGGYGLQGMTRTILIFPVFMASWLPLQVVSLFRDTRQWHAITHKGQDPVAGCRALR